MTEQPPTTATTTSPRPGSLGWKTDFQVWLGLLVFQLLSATWRLRVVGREGLEAYRRQQPGGRGRFVLVLWHGEMMPAVKWHVPDGMAVLVSTSRDGEIIARVITARGSRAVRGSSSQGGRAALIGLIRHLEGGGEAIVTPDGPRGPRHSFAQGAIAAAARAQVPIVAMRATASRAWYFGSWDRLMLPKPFATVTMAYSAPLMVAVDARGSALPAEAERFTQVMADVGAVIGADA